MKKRTFAITLALILAVSALSACGGTPQPPTATPVDVTAIYIAAAQTIIAQFTQNAPTITPTPLFTDTSTATLTPALPSATPTVTQCENAAFVSDVTIPDGTTLAVNQAFTKTWQVQNTGTCTWIAGFYLGYAYGETLGGLSVPLTAAVAPGQTVDLSVNLRVPAKTGKLTGVWTLFDNRGVRFGAYLTVVINVGVPSPTPTLNVTATPGLTDTATPVLTDTPSATP
ncbi:MAG: NBR1-Ig-like domain-containing protein [Anaerolineales bacterium]